MSNAKDTSTAGADLGFSREGRVFKKSFAMVLGRILDRPK